MSDMRAVCAGIAAKYEQKEPPADWPLYGDTVEFTDELNGKRWSGVVLRAHPLSPVGGYRTAIWVVRVQKSLDTGAQVDDDCAASEGSVKYKEITRIIRKEPDNG